MMEPIPTTSRDVAIPAVALHALKSSLLDEVDASVVTRALHEAGVAAGMEFGQGFEAALEGIDPRALSQGEFWERLSRYLRRCGWGGVEHLERHEGVGGLRSEDWVEAHGSVAHADLGCWFSSGLLSGLLSELAGAEVSVLEVSCRSRGDDACEFAFGSEAAIDELFAHLSQDQPLEQALAELT
jgi:predicted hydrocarbon binding protein